MRIMICVKTTAGKFDLRLRRRAQAIRALTQVRVQAKIAVAARVRGGIEIVKPRPDHPEA